MTRIESFDTHGPLLKEKNDSRIQSEGLFVCYPKGDD